MHENIHQGETNDTDGAGSTNTWDRCKQWLTFPTQFCSSAWWCHFVCHFNKFLYFKGGPCISQIVTSKAFLEAAKGCSCRRRGGRALGFDNGLYDLRSTGKQFLKIIWIPFGSSFLIESLIKGHQRRSKQGPPTLEAAHNHGAIEVFSQHLLALHRILR